jgi:transposase
MKVKVNQFTDELKFRVVQEYMNTDVSQRDLMRKFQIRGNNTIKKWMVKFDLKAPSQGQIELQRIMSKETEKTPQERELEAKVKKLEEQLKFEQFRTLALNTMIDVAERDLKITIRKKPGAKL